LFIAGDQVPVIPFVEEVGSVNVPPEQMGAIGLNVGVTLELPTCNDIELE
jgi:hypothetical protein